MQKRLQRGANIGILAGATLAARVDLVGQSNRDCNEDMQLGAGSENIVLGNLHGPALHVNYEKSEGHEECHQQLHHTAALDQSCDSNQRELT